MKKTFYLEGERITLHRAKELLGKVRYEQVVHQAKAAFLAEPLKEISYMTRLGILTIWFQLT